MNTNNTEYNAATFDCGEMIEDFNDNFRKSCADANAVKPTVIEVTRYFRPRYSNGGHPLANMIKSDHGVTVMFTLNYETLTFKARWSICNGDNFNKVTGIQWAQACPTPISGTIHPGWALYDEILHELTSINMRHVESQVKCNCGQVTVDFEYDKKDMRNFALLQSEIMQSYTHSLGGKNAQ